MSQTPLTLVLQGLFGMNPSKSIGFATKLVDSCIHINTKIEERMVRAEVEEMDSAIQGLVSQRDAFIREFNEDNEFIASTKKKMETIKEGSLIAFHWREISETEKHIESLQKQRDDIETQLEAINEKKRNIVARKKPSFITIALDVLNESLNDERQSL